MKAISIGLALFASVVAGSASAATLTSGAIGSAPAAGESIFSDYDTITPTATGTGFTTFSGSRADFAAPPNDTTYLVVLGTGSATYDFGAARSSFSVDVGTVDPYNSIKLLFAGGSTQTFGEGGSSALPSYTSSRLFFTADSGPGITGVTFASAYNSMELDNIAVAAVPEPATWALMIGGFGMVGGIMRRRKQSARFARA